MSAQAFPLLSVGVLLAQMVGGPGEWPLAQTVAQFGLGGIVAWMLYTQHQDKIADRRREEVRDEILRRNHDSMDKLARAVLLLTLSLKSDSARDDEAKDMLRGLSDNSPR